MLSPLSLDVGITDLFHLGRLDISCLEEQERIGYHNVWPASFYYIAFLVKKNYLTLYPGSFICFLGGHIEIEY